MQHQIGKSRIHNSVVNAKATMDLIIVDVPEGLLVPTVSALIDVGPPWNQSAESVLEDIGDETPKFCLMHSSS
jgi:hypothetical protein